MKYWHVPCYQWLRRCEVKWQVAFTIIYWLSVPFVVIFKIWLMHGYFTTCKYRRFRRFYRSPAGKITCLRESSDRFFGSRSRGIFVNTKQNKNARVSWEITAVSDTTEIWKAFVFWHFQCVIYENTKLIWLSAAPTASALGPCPNIIQIQ